MKEKDDLIRGKDAIEEFTGHAYEALMFHWKSAFDFPIKKVDGFPALSKNEFYAWARFWKVANIPPGKITSEMLEKEARRQRIAAMENTKLKNIDEIARFINRSTFTVSDWQKNYDACPIEKTNRVLSVGRRDLIEWLEKTGISWGHYPGVTRI
mgnify:CR=1 FL=1